MSKVGQELASVPIGDMITSLGIGIAKAQFELDQTSADIARMMSGIDPADRVQFGGQQLSLIELGFTPTFYQFIESTIEVKMVVTMSISSESSVSSKTTSKSNSFQSNWAWWRGGGARVSATTRTVDAKFSNTYDYSVEGSSLVRTKLVPVPPPAILEERIRLLMDEEAEVRYRAEVRRLLTKHREPLVNAINGWQKRMSPQASISSATDLQGAIIDLNPGYRNMISDYPDILADGVINGALRQRFVAYQQERQTILAELEGAIASWEPDSTRVYPDLRSIQQASTFSLHGSLRSKLSFYTDLWSEPIVQAQLEQSFRDYQASLAEELSDGLTKAPLPTNDVPVSPSSLVTAYLLSMPELQRRIAPHPGVLVDSGVEGAANLRYSGWLEGFMLAELPKWPPSTDLLVDSLDDYFNQFIVTLPQIGRQLAAFPQARGKVVESGDLQDHLDAWKGRVTGVIQEELTKWSLSTEVVVGSIEEYLDEFLDTLPRISQQVKAFPDLREATTFRDNLTAHFETWLQRTVLEWLTNWDYPLDDSITNGKEFITAFGKAHQKLGVLMEAFPFSDDAEKEVTGRADALQMQMAIRIADSPVENEED